MTMSWDTLTGSESAIRMGSKIKNVKLIGSLTRQYKNHSGQKETLYFAITIPLEGSKASQNPLNYSDVV
jgi:hypothetical protein